MSMPDTIGQYRVLDQIGAGGMATVYKGYHERLDRYVAIKVMHQNFLQDPSFRSRFEREARIVASLEHPNIVPIYDFAEYNGRPYLIMKFVEGETLKDHLRGGELTQDDAVRLLEETANALTYAHGRGILHRDIKPSNIVIDENGRAYLTDFGLARIAQHGESTMSADVMLGTPHYISPEQAQGTIDLDARTDIYSLGIIAFELLTGRVPFTGDSAYAIVHAHIYNPPPMPSDINDTITPAVEDVLLTALAKNPKERYKTASEMIIALKTALQGKSAPASPTTPARQHPPTVNVDDDPTPRKAKNDIVQLPELELPPMPKLSDLNSDMSAEDFADEVRKWGDHIGHRAGDWGSRFGERGSKIGERLGSRIAELAQKAEVSILEHADEEDDKKGRRSKRRSKRAAKPLSPEEEIRKRVEKRLEERNGLYSHLAAYVMVNLMLWGIWLFAGGGFPWPAMVSMGWGIGMMAHYIDYRSNYGSGREKREQMIQDEIARERNRLQNSQEQPLAKPKNDDLFYDDSANTGGIRLTSDGEFTDSYISELQDDDEQSARNQG